VSVIFTIRELGKHGLSFYMHGKDRKDTFDESLWNRFDPEEDWRIILKRIKDITV